MKCLYCENNINLNRLDWCYSIGEKGIVYYHLICITYEQEMSRIETEDYLTQMLEW